MKRKMISILAVCCVLTFSLIPAFAAKQAGTTSVTYDDTNTKMFLYVSNGYGSVSSDFMPWVTSGTYVESTLTVEEKNDNFLFTQTKSTGKGTIHRVSGNSIGTLPQVRYKFSYGTSSAYGNESSACCLSEKAGTNETKSITLDPFKDGAAHPYVRFLVYR